MKELLRHWNIRPILVLFGIIIIAALFGAIYYNIVRLDRDRPIQVENYPNGLILVEEAPDANRDRVLYVVRVSNLATIEREATRMTEFYVDQGFECVDGRATIYVEALRTENAYINTTCFIDRSHPLGFTQYARVLIQPERAAYQYEDNDPNRAIIGGGSHTGQIFVELVREWSSYNVFGG